MGQLTAVSVDTDGNVKLDLIVRIVRGNLSDIPRNSTSSEHDTRETVVHGLLGGDLADPDSPSLPDTVPRDNLFNLVYPARELGGPLEDVVQHAVREIVRHTTRSDVSGVQSSSRYSLVEFHQLFTFFETPQEGSEGTDVHGVGENGHEMVEDSGDLSEKSSDPLGTLGNLDVQQLLDGQRVTQLVGHYKRIREDQRCLS